MYNDEKFLTILYAQNHEKYVSRDYAGTRTNVCEFLSGSEAAVMVVDCENSDLGKVYSFLRILAEGKKWGQRIYRRGWSRKESGIAC